MKKWIIFTALFCVFALPGVGSSEEKKKEKETSVTMEEVVVTATKTEEKRKDVPNTVIIMDEIDIQESPARSLGELLSNELGIDWRTRGNYGGAREEINIRGMEGNATQVLVNGVSINSPSFGSADVGRIPLNSIERIEVVKGSGSLLYGSGAMAGTINIITKRPKRDKVSFKANAGYGSEDTTIISAEQGMFIKGDFGYYFTASRLETDGFRDNSDLTHNDLSLKLVLDKGEALDISLYGDYIDREYGVPGVQPPEGTRDYFIRGEKFYNMDSATLLDRGGNEDGHVVLQIKSRPQDWLSWRLRGDYTNMENYNYSRYASNGTGQETWTTNEVLGTEANAHIKPFEGAGLLLGAEYKDYDWENEGINLDATGSQVSGTRATTNAGLHSTGTFAEAKYRPCTFFKALAGIRHEDHSEFGTENLPLYGLIFNPHENTALKFSHGKHFLAPTPNDLFWPGSGNPDLRPETGWHTDATLEQSIFENKMFITFSYFHWDVDDKIQWAPDATGAWTPQNLDRYKGDGWEIGMKLGPVNHMRFSMDYTYTEAREENPFVTRRASYTPEQQFKGNVAYWTDFGLTATAIFRYTSDRLYYGNNNSLITPLRTLESYWTTDVKVEQRLFEHWLLSLRGNNLFNKEYDTYAANFTNRTTRATTIEGYPGAGRSLFINLTYEY
ncbi:MAG: TonB-dependent receptor [Pseudomonadota bacterium]